ncbi:peptidoglycan bridge formation glycyltransferase FemA/FemB family protein [Candidatus Peregrinibacteria bacterium]|nr:peptidoglycan bridge formation glycyltransferase FemA/FemB family protein [Candidatus Peregrinibacteria bacterium]
MNYIYGIIKPIMSDYINTTPDTDKLEAFVEKHPLGSIHQIPQWGDFQTTLKGREKYFLFTQKNSADQIINSALIIKQDLPFGLSWFYSPRGPLIDWQNIDGAKPLFDAIKNEAKKQKAVFLRVDPPVTTSYGLKNSKNAHAHFHPECTNIVDLNQSEEDILKQMKPKGRYNIKVAKKHNVEIKVSEDPIKDIEVFYKLFSATTQRDAFHGHPLHFYKAMVEKLPAKNVKLYFAYHENEPLASAIVTFFKDTATYYFGASSSNKRNTMAPYLLHWQIMQYSKKAGFKNYDFFGIAPPNEKNHPWSKITDFKLKFGGEIIQYQNAKELIYKPFWYQVIKIYKQLRGLN